MQISVLEEQKEEDAEKLDETNEPSDADPSSQINQNVSSNTKPDMNDIVMGESVVVNISDIIYLLLLACLISLTVIGVIAHEDGWKDLVCTYDHLNLFEKVFHLGFIGCIDIDHFHFTYF